ncbi:MAG TPA: hypothetical protein VF518_11255, partial [Polyangia bacterium]
MSSPRVRTSVLIGLAVLGLTAATHLTSPSVYESTDFLRFSLPLHEFGATALRDGRLPLWNPHVNLGRPHLADLQTGVFYPTNLLYVALPARAAFFLIAVVHLALLALGTALLASHLGANPPAAWAAGLTFAFAGVTSSTLHTGTIEGVAALAYFPWVFLLGARLQDKPHWRDFIALTAALALQLLCGHPQYSWITAIGVGVFLAGRRAGRPVAAQLRLIARDLGYLLACGALAMALDAVQLLPFLDLAREGNRPTPSLALANAWTLTANDWASLFRPAKPTFVINWATNFYPGLLASMGGLVALFRWKDRNRRALLLMSVFAALIAAGTRTPAFSLLYHTVPGLSVLRLHGRAATLVVMALCLTGALALGDRRTLRRGLGITLSAILASAVNVAIEIQIPAANRSWSEVAARLGLVFAAAILLTLPRRPGPLRRWQWLALGALQLLDLGWATARMKQTYVFPHQFPAEGIVTTQLEHRGWLVPGAPPPRISMPFPYVRENAGMTHGWSTFNGYVSLSLNRVWTYLHLVLGIEPSATLNTIPANDIYHAGPFPYASMNLVLGWDPRSRSGVLNPRPDPRAYLALAVALEPSWRTAIERMRRGHDFHKQPLVETPVALASPPRLSPSSPADCTARIVEFAAERIHVETECAAAALLVVAE